MKKKTRNSSFREHKKFCYGVLLWSPKDFKSATMDDITLAYEGYKMANGIKQKEYPDQDLIDEMKRKFPDGNN